MFSLMFRCAVSGAVRPRMYRYGEVGKLAEQRFGLCVIRRGVLRREQAVTQGTVFRSEKS